jgi:hypothetical protein
MITIRRSLISCGTRLLAIRTNLIVVRALLIAVSGRLFKVRTRPVAFRLTCCAAHLVYLSRRTTSRSPLAGRQTLRSMYSFSQAGCPRMRSGRSHPWPRRAHEIEFATRRATGGWSGGATVAAVAVWPSRPSA